MSDEKISQLSDGSAPTDADLFPVARSTSNFSLSWAEIKTALSSLYLALSTVTTKGDILVATGSGAVSRLAVGSNTQVLTADSTQTTGVKWAAAGSGSSPLTTKGDVWGYSSADARIPVGADGKVLTAASAQSLGVAYQFPPGYELNYTQITSNVNVASTTESSGTTIISPGAITFDGAPVIVEFFCLFQSGTTANNVFHACLFEGATQITRFGATLLSPAAQQVIPFYGCYRFTPSAASHTYTVTAFVNSTTGTPAVLGSAAGTASGPPAFVRFTKV